MNDFYQDVRTLHLRLRLPTEDDGPPELPDDETVAHDAALIVRALRKMKGAQTNRDLGAYAAALVELTYSALAAAQTARLPFEELWSEVHRAEMQKIRDEKGRVRMAPGAAPADIRGIIEEATVEGRLKWPVPKVGQFVRAVTHIGEIPAGSQGVIDEDFGTGVVVAWNLPGRPIPQGYFDQDTGKPRKDFDRKAPNAPKRVPFDKRTDLKLLEPISW